MEWKDVLEVGLGPLAFIAFLKLVFRDMADLRQRLERLEDQASRQNEYLSRLVNAVEAQALRQGLRLRGAKEVQDGK
jgi:septal ring factor EnvC (AmiA/AmiB activator)